MIFPVSNAARNLGVIFDSHLALKEQVNKLCQLAYLEIRRIGSVQQFVCFEATKTLVSSFLSRFDYCNALLAGSPQVILDKIQRAITAQLASFSKFLNLPISFFFSTISTGY